MSEPLEPPQPSLQFDTVEGVAPGAVSCAACACALPSEYHELNGAPVCISCRTKAEAEYVQDKKWSRFFVAAAYGSGAAFVGWLLYWGFVRITEINLGLIAIAVGWLVGKAVMKGSNGRGGTRYQFLAAILTYVAVSMAFGALVFEEAMKVRDKKVPVSASSSSSSTPAPANPGAGSAASTPTPAAPKSFGSSIVALLVLFGFLLVSPFLVGFSNILGWLIMAFGVFEAWKLTREIPLLTGGPYRIASGQAEPQSAPSIQIAE